MKILFWNLGYGRGIDGSIRDYIGKFHRFIYQTKYSQEKILDSAITHLNQVQPDIFAYAEISLGSWGRANFNQHSYLVQHLDQTPIRTAAAAKYGNTILNLMPFHGGNANGVVTHIPAEVSEQYLQNSRKKLVYSIKTDDLTVFAVHLPLVSTDRKKQLAELANLVNQTTGDVVVCGDFNILDGIDELTLLSNATDLVIPETLEPTFPAYRPKHYLDIFLYRSPNRQTTPRMKTLPLAASDHLPILLYI